MNDDSLREVLDALDWLTRVHDARPSRERLDILRRYIEGHDEDRPTGIALHKIVIEQIMTEDADLIDHLSAETVDGETIPIGAALGMLRLAEDTLLEETRE